MFINSSIVNSPIAIHDVITDRRLQVRRYAFAVLARAGPVIPRQPILHLLRQLNFYLTYCYNSFEIKHNGNFIINKDLNIKDINYSNKFKSLLYDIYGPKNINYTYNLSIYKIILYSNQNIFKTIYYDSSYISILNKNNLHYENLLKKPYYLLKGFNINVDLLYIKDLNLINNQLNIFTNNIDYNSIILNNPYNTTIKTCLIVIFCIIGLYNKKNYINTNFNLFKNTLVNSIHKVISVISFN